MRYFLDTEYNGWRGELLSLALVPEDWGEEFYVTIDSKAPLEPWVQENVVPYLKMVPAHLLGPSLPLDDAARAFSAWLMRELDAQWNPGGGVAGEIEIIADWPEDISQICNMLTVGPGVSVELPPIAFRLLRYPGFSTAANSRVPHNALHDARALRDHVLAME